jgi:hypothetical protein
VVTEGDTKHGVAIRLLELTRDLGKAEYRSRSHDWKARESSGEK